MKREAAASTTEYRTKLTLVDDYLTQEEGGDCGGVVLTSRDKRIVCNNTLKSRLDLCFEELLPQIRKVLFPIKEEEIEKSAEKKEEAPKTGHHGHKK